MSPSRSRNMSRNLRQTAVYWGNPVNDGSGGRTFDDPVEIGVRWEDKQELFIDSSGQEKYSHSVVYLAIDADIGDYIFLGALADLPSGEDTDPLTVTGAYEIRGLTKIPDLKAESFVRKIWL